MDYFNKDLEDIGFSIIEASDELKPYIHNYWIVRKKNLSEPITNKILSDGNSGFIINFSNPYSITINDKAVQCNDNFTFTGQTKYPMYMTFENTLDAIGIRFNSAGAFTFLNTDIYKFKDTIFGLNSSHVLELDEFYNELTLAKSIKDKITHIENFLLKILRNNKSKNSVWIFDFVKSIVLRKGDIKIEEFCHKFDISRKDCERKFKKEIGFTPKEYARIIRMQHTKDSISSLNTKSLTSISYENGFFDQSHFIREFKFFMNETPKEYFIRKQNMAKSYQYKKYKDEGK